MNYEQLKEKVSFNYESYGTYKVYIEFRNKKHSCLTHNTLAIDRIKDDEDKSTPWKIYSTKRQAYMDLWNECKYKNELK